MSIRSELLGKKCGDKNEPYSMTPWTELTKEDVVCSREEYPNPPCDPILIIHYNRPHRADCYIRDNLIQGMKTGPIIYKCVNQNKQSESTEIILEHPYYKLPLSGQFIDYTALKSLTNTNHWAYLLYRHSKAKIGTAGIHFISRVHCSPEHYEIIYSLYPLSGEDVKMYLDSELYIFDIYPYQQYQEKKPDIAQEIERVITYVKNDEDEDKESYLLLLRDYYITHPEVIRNLFIKYPEIFTAYYHTLSGLQRKELLLSMGMGEDEISKYILSKGRTKDDDYALNALITGVITHVYYQLRSDNYSELEPRIIEILKEIDRDELEDLDITIEHSYFPVNYTAIIYPKWLTRYILYTLRDWELAGGLISNYYKKHKEQYREKYGQGNIKEKLKLERKRIIEEKAESLKLQSFLSGESIPRPRERRREERQRSRERRGERRRIRERMEEERQRERSARRRTRPRERGVGIMWGPRSR